MLPTVSTTATRGAVGIKGPCHSFFCLHSPEFHQAVTAIRNHEVENEAQNCAKILSDYASNKRMRQLLTNEPLTILEYFITLTKYGKLDVK